MKLSLLLIPLLFFMTGCSIDWNDEKDAQIAELEKQVNLSTIKIKEIEANLQDTTLRLQEVTSLFNVKSKEDKITNSNDRSRNTGSEYPKEVFIDENSGLCIIEGGTDLEDNKREIAEKCKPRDILLSNVVTDSGYRCILNPNGNGNTYVDLNTDGFTPLGEYYFKTRKYIIFFYKTGDYCYQIIDDVDPIKFRVEKLDDQYWNGEYGTDGEKFYSFFGVFDSKAELTKRVTEYFIQDAKDRGYTLPTTP